MRSGVIEELPFPALAYRFTHELVRRALYDRLSVLRRAELHLRIAAGAGGGRPAAARACARRPGPPFRGGGADRRARRKRWSTTCSPRRRRRRRWRTTRPPSVCARLCRWASTDERQRAEILLDLGTALFRAGRSLDSLQSFRQAAEIARELGEGELLARAAIGFETSCWRPGLTDEGARELLEEASAALARGGLHAARRPAREPRPRARVRGQTQIRRRLARADAIAMARRIDDRPGLATVLDGGLLGARDHKPRGSSRDAWRGTRAGRRDGRRRGPGGGDAVAGRGADGTR